MTFVEDRVKGRNIELVVLISHFITTELATLCFSLTLVNHMLEP
jgi:hypothetical protein